MRRLVPRPVLLIVLLAGAVVAAQEKPGAAADDWLGWAGTAWKYFAPSPTGNVHSSTGLNRANQWWGFLTDWDLASYVVATLHAKDLGLISETGTWGASYRLDKVLTFLEQRPLRPEDGLPYWCYKWDAYPYEPGSSGKSLPGDAGMHLLALYLVKQAYPSLATRVDAIVNRVRAAYLANYYDASGRLIENYDWYRYYDLVGFEEFGFPVDASRQALEEALAGPHVDVYGQSLIRVETTAEPFLIGLFLLPMDSRFQDYAYRTYKAMEGRFNNLGILTAWSECARDKDPFYVYEWVVVDSGETWKLQPSTDENGNPYTPVVTSKAVFGYHALYHTPYTQNLMDKVFPKIQTSNIGFTEGANEGSGGNVGDGQQVATDKTNSLIISAARHALSVTVTATGTSTATSTSYVTSYTTTAVTSYTSTQALTSTIPTVTTVVLLPLTVTSTAQSTQYLTSILTTTVTSYTGTQASTSTVVVPTTVTVGPSTTTLTVLTTQVLTSTGTTAVTGYTTTTVTSYTSTQTSASTIPTLTTVVLLPSTVTSTVQSTQYLTSILTTTATSYTGTSTSTSTIVVPTTVTVGPSTSTAQTTQAVTSTGTTTVTGYTTTTVTSYTGTTTSTSTIPTVTTVVLVPSTVTSTVQSTQYLTSTATTTVTSYTATTTTTSTSVAYTTVTTSLGGAGAGGSSSLAYLGFLSLVAVTVGHSVTTGKGRKVLRVRSLMGRRCLRS